MTAPRILVWLQIDQGEVTPESWGASRRAARLAAAYGSRPHGVLLSAGADRPADLDGRSGLETLWWVRHHGLALYNQEAYLAAVRAVWKESGADLFLTPSTPDGRDLALALSLDQGLPYAASALKLDFDDDALLVRQPLPGGAAMGRIRLPAGRGCVALMPQMLERGLPAPSAVAAHVEDDGGPSFGAGFPVRSFLVPPVPAVAPLATEGGGRARVPPGDEGPLPDLRELTVELAAPAWPTLAVEPADPATVDVSEAEFVVGGGYGFGTAGGFAPLWELAEALGAAVGVTRPAVDEGWAPYERQIGQTGRYLRARAYLGLGISGAVHHTAGVADCDLVVAVNRDPAAPIFQVADVGFVADVHELVPALLAEISRRRRPAPAATADRESVVDRESAT